MDELEYITRDALIMCDQGGAPDFFKPTFNSTVKIHGCLVATNMDALPVANIPSFKVCKISGGPCLPATMPMTWQDTWQVKVKGVNTLVGKSTCLCPIGGKIEFMTSGQVPLPPDMAAEVELQQSNAQKELDASGNDSNIGEAGFGESLIPVWGSGRDLINDIQTGDTDGAIMNGVFLLWDVGSIVAGVFSFGTGTVAMQGAKAGLKASLKAGAKAIAKSSLRQLGKAAFKKLEKEVLEASMKLQATLCKLSAVLGCFTGDTLISTPDGLKQIKDVRIGDEVYSYDAATQTKTIRKVTSLFEGEVEEIFEIETETGVISTTRNHPFFVNGEFKDAEQINIGEFLFSYNKTLLEVISLNYVPKTVKVYNFEVEENHCYFVGEDGVLVLNACKSNYRIFYLNAYKKMLQFIKKHPKIKIEIHHRIPKEWFEKGVFNDGLNSFKNSLSNLVGLDKKFHNEISRHWKDFRLEYQKVHKRLPTQAEVYKKAKELDKIIEKQLRTRGY